MKKGIIVCSIIAGIIIIIFLLEKSSPKKETRKQEDPIVKTADILIENAEDADTEDIQKTEDIETYEMQKSRIESTLRQMALALKMYEQDYKQHPSDLGNLFPRYFSLPIDEHLCSMEFSSYEYTPNEDILIKTNVSSHREYLTLDKSGRVEILYK